MTDQLHCHSNFRCVGLSWAVTIFNFPGTRGWSRRACVRHRRWRTKRSWPLFSPTFFFSFASFLGVSTFMGGIDLQNKPSGSSVREEILLSQPNSTQHNSSWSDNVIGLSPPHPPPQTLCCCCSSQVESYGNVHSHLISPASPPTSTITACTAGMYWNRETFQILAAPQPHTTLQHSFPSSKMLRRIRHSMWHGLQ